MPRKKSRGPGSAGKLIPQARLAWAVRKLSEMNTWPGDAVGDLEGGEVGVRLGDRFGIRLGLLALGERPVDGPGLLQLRQAAR